jgi:hypothetical protein
MTTTAPPSSASKRRRNLGESAALQPVTGTRLPVSVPEPTSAPQGRGPTNLFQVSFASAMSDGDVALLARTLDLTTHIDPKLRNSPASPGVVRLDHSPAYS